MTRAVELSDLLAGIVEVPASSNQEVVGVCLDSRHARPGFLFMACSGISSHGLDYLDQAIRLGVQVVCWEPAEGVRDPELPEGLTGIEVPELSEWAGVIASRYYGNPSQQLKVIGVTGTNGKTSVTHLVARALELSGCHTAVYGTLGNGFLDQLNPSMHTTADAVRLQEMTAEYFEAGAEAVAMEVSSHALDQHRVDGMQFHVAVFTNLTHDHLDYHGDLGSYAQAKRRLFGWPGLKHAVINADDAVGRDILSDLDDSVQSIAFSMASELPIGVTAGKVLEARAIEYRDSGLGFELLCEQRSVPVSIALFGRFNVANALAAAGVLLAMGYSLDRIADVLGKVEPVRGRMQRLGGGTQPLVVVDYAHTPDALMQVLVSTREHTRGELVCVFGCGGDRDRAKRPEMGRIAESLADRVWVTDDNPRTEDGDHIIAEILAGMRSASLAQVERDRARAIAAAIRSCKPEDSLVIAGKGHEDYQIVGNTRSYFSDAETAQAILGGLR